VFVVLIIDRTLYLDGFFIFDGSIEVDIAYEVLFDILCLFSLSITFEVAESLMVELLFTLLVELPMDVDAY
jgi:hypothetical protein